MTSVEQSPLYAYRVPRGFGDTYFCYVFDAQNENLTDGQSYFKRRVNVANGDFLLRYISGFNTIASRFQFYDWIERRFTSAPATLGGFASQAVMPEKPYPDQGSIQLDLHTVAQDVAGVDGALTVYRSQLQFWGARRRQNVESDPVASDYQYYERPFQYSYELSIDRYASSGGVFTPAQQLEIRVENYDFELRRIELALEDDGQLSQFKILLYDQNLVRTSNLPILSNYLCHLDPNMSSGELAFFPSPPLLYRVDSVIRFDIYSLLFAPVVLPATFHLLFHGVRRIKC